MLVRVQHPKFGLGVVLDERHSESGKPVSVVVFDADPETERTIVASFLTASDSPLPPGAKAKAKKKRKAKDAINAALNPDPTNPSYIVALNLLSRSPGWLTSIRALPMFLGLDLRGGVYFLMQVDMKSALTKKAEALTGDIRTLLRDKNLRHAGISREGQTLRVRFRDSETRDKAAVAIADALPILTLDRRNDGRDQLLVATLKPAALKKEQDLAIKQNIVTLNLRPRIDARS